MARSRLVSRNRNGVLAGSPVQLMVMTWPACTPRRMGCPAYSPGTEHLGPAVAPATDEEVTPTTPEAAAAMASASTTRPAALDVRWATAEAIFTVVTDSASSRARGPLPSGGASGAVRGIVVRRSPVARQPGTASPER